MDASQAHSAQTHSAQTHSAKRRYETFCDCFMALVLVSSALQLRAPTELQNVGLFAVRPTLWLSFAVYALNFFTIAVLWCNQRRLTRSLPAIPPRVVPIMLAVMALLALTPLATGVLAAAPLAPGAISLYGAIWAAISVFMILARFSLIHIYPENPGLAAEHQSRTYRSIAALLLYGGAIPLSQMSPAAALAAFALTPALFLIRDSGKAG